MLFRSWDPPVVTVSALEARGMDTVWSIIEEHRRKLSATSELAAKRREQRQAWFWAMIEDGLKQHFLARDDVQQLLPELEAAVLNAHLTPTEATRRLLALRDRRPSEGAAESVGNARVSPRRTVT